MFTKPLTRAPRYVLIKSFFLAIGSSFLYDLLQTFLKRFTITWNCSSKARRLFDEKKSRISFCFYSVLKFSDCQSKCKFSWKIGPPLEVVLFNRSVHDQNLLFHFQTFSFAEKYSKFRKKCECISLPTSDCEPNGI